MKSNKKTNIIVVGGGFGGVKSALKLASYSELFNITLISDLPYLVYYPTLFHSALGQKTNLTSIELSHIFNKKNVNLVHGKAVSIDRKSKQIILEDNSTHSYDKLILSMGEVANYFNIDGLDKFSYSVKSEPEVIKFNRHLHDYLLTNKRPDHNYFVIGAGPTGIELASRLPEYINYLMDLHDIEHKTVRVELIEARNQLLPMFSKKYSQQIAHRLAKLGVSVKLNSAVTGLNENQLFINGTGQDSNTVIWTAGVSTNPFYKNNEFIINKRGKVTTDVYLQTEEDIFIAGDNASTPYSGLAQTALNDGVFIANNIIRQKKNKMMRSYCPKVPISIIPVGKKWAGFSYKKISLFGFSAAILRQFGDLDGYLKLLPLSQAFKLWLESFADEPNDCIYCSTQNNL